MPGSDRPPAARAPPGGRTILIRLAGEISIKSRATRSAFIRRLRRNLEDALASAGGAARLESGWDRLYVRGADDEVLAVLPRVFGISSFSPVEVETPATLAAIVDAGEAVFSERLRGKTFAVRARRAGEHAFSSRDVLVELYFKSASTAEAASRLGIPEGTVKSRAYYAVRSLKIVLGSVDAT